MTRILVTGTAGFIGSHMARRLLDEGHEVHGFDGLTDFYDPAIKRARHALLRESPGFTATEALLQDRGAVEAAVDRADPEVVIHLAAQAGVRHSLDAPLPYVAANVEGSVNLMVALRGRGVRHLVLASTSSIYGGNGKMPFVETDRADSPVSAYAATKRAAEALAHAEAHITGLPITAARLFTVYGPGARPDLAMSLFVEAIRAGRPIDVFNGGVMARDFTYIDDVTLALRLLMDHPPIRHSSPEMIEPGDSLSPVAPYRVVNVGQGRAVPLVDFIAAIELALGRTAERRLLPMQPGDVKATWADTTLLHRLTGFAPATSLADGVAAFVAWHRETYPAP